MAFQTWVTLVNSGQYNAINSGTALVNSKTKTDISPGGAVVGQALQIPAGFPSQIVRTLQAARYLQPR